MMDPLQNSRRDLLLAPLLAAPWLGVSSLALTRPAEASPPNTPATLRTVATVSIAAERAFSTTSPGRCTASATASATSCNPLGSGDGIHSDSTGGRGVADTSSITCPMYFKYTNRSLLPVMQLANTTRTMFLLDLTAWPTKILDGAIAMIL